MIGAVERSGAFQIAESGSLWALRKGDDIDGGLPRWRDIGSDNRVDGVTLVQRRQLTFPKVRIWSLIGCLIWDK